MLLNCDVEKDSWESLGQQRDQTSHTKGKTDAVTEFPIIWQPDVKSQLFRKDPDAGKDWRHEEKGMTEDEMIGWHYQLDGHEFE